MKRLCMVLCICGLLSVSHARENEFEQFGDAFRFLPLYVMIVSVAMEDYEGASQLALGTLSTQLATEGIKKSFEYLHEKKGYDLDFAKRPCCDNWQGMPSGHASGAFSAAGYVYYRYGWKPAIPVGILADTHSSFKGRGKKAFCVTSECWSVNCLGFCVDFYKGIYAKKYIDYAKY